MGDDDPVFERERDRPCLVGERGCLGDEGRNRMGDVGLGRGAVVVVLEREGRSADNERSLDNVFFFVKVTGTAG